MKICKLSGVLKKRFQQDLYDRIYKTPLLSKICPVKTQAPQTVNKGAEQHEYKPVKTAFPVPEEK